MSQNIEEAIAFHCGPALVGLKPANLMVCNKKKYPEYEKSLKRLNKELNKRGIFFHKLCECEHKVTILVYQRILLKNYLDSEEIKAFLAELNYPVLDGFYALLKYLQIRMGEESFPHEIGLFLGYPLEDVEGFLINQGRNYKLCGYWKVYGNAEAAKGLFEKYTKCRNYLRESVLNGMSINQLLPTNYVL